MSMPFCKMAVVLNNNILIDIEDANTANGVCCVYPRVDWKIKIKDRVETS